jgi:phosphatidylserine decarboxylase
MPIAPEGRPFVAGAAVILAALALLQWPLTFGLWLLVTLWVIWFFRDPVREGPRGEDTVISPADGKVVDIREVAEPEFLGGTAQRVCVFMNVFDCHVNRYPLSGRVAFRHYRKGQFLNAADGRASLENEQSAIGLETAHGRVLLRQIAGLVARRIITDHEVGTEVRQGQRLGMIRFGSRVDIYLPMDARVQVRVGQRVRANQSVIAQWS